MATHEERLEKVEKEIFDPEEGLRKYARQNSIGYIKLNAKINAILWMFGILISIGLYASFAISR
jgi:hypothetical protein